MKSQEWSEELTCQASPLRGIGHRIGRFFSGFSHLWGQAVEGRRLYEQYGFHAMPQIRKNWIDD